MKTLKDRIEALEAIKGIEDKIDRLEFDDDAFALVRLREQMIASNGEFYSVSIHLVDLVYGGPEEGGWYVRVSEPANQHWGMTNLFGTREEAREYSRSLQRLINLMNVGRPSIDSVMSIGRYATVIQEGYPHAEPTEWPQYC